MAERARKSPAHPHGGKSPSTHYEVLGVPRSAAPADIRAAFRALAKLHHPDVRPQEGSAPNERFIEINRAFEVLGDPEARRVYDRRLEEAEHAARSAGLHTPGPAGRGHFTWSNIAGRGDAPPGKDHADDAESAHDLHELGDIYDTFFGGGPEDKDPA